MLQDKIHSGLWSSRKGELTLMGMETPRERFRRQLDALDAPAIRALLDEKGHALASWKIEMAERRLERLEAEKEDALGGRREEREEHGLRLQRWQLILAAVTWLASLAVTWFLARN